ncbi:Transposase IS200 like protein [Calidithermus terrae]|uniref:Transposase IS200 like protein n=1 Tax=Calidithermus terrae TaxID=1408545 RepID=A0A399F6Y2_9DEIN|nr:IS200/IS605 family transposase [Calidithermus terrae]RIH90391.1 Transposase IS200 like protein [Calidithermus terrae]
MSTAYKHKHTSVSLLRYHFVFVPKRRRKILVGPLAERLRNLLVQKCAELGWEIIALEIMPDHVRLFLSTGPGVAPNQVAHRLKGYTSHVLRREFPHLIRLPALWTRSYFVSTAGMVSSETIEQYVAAQKTRD